MEENIPAVGRQVYMDDLTIIGKGIKLRPFSDEGKVRKTVIEAVSTGKCKGRDRTFISVVDNTFTGYDWDVVLSKQDELKARFERG